MVTQSNNKSSNNLLKRTVLVVEDNDLNREMLVDILSDSYNVIEAEDGVVGMEKLKENANHLACVMLDVQMPRMDGFEFLDIYTKSKNLSSVPIIVTTSSSEDEAKCLALGAADFVAKPYNPNVILRRVEALIRLRESIETLQAVEYDSITGLYNKNAFIHYAQVRFELEPDEKYDLFLLDIEDFSYINEKYGEAAGDKLLAYIGQSITGLSDEEILFCRYNADKFIALGKHLDIEVAKKAIEEKDKKLHSKCPINDVVFKYALYPEISTQTPMNVLCDRLMSVVLSIKHQYNNNIAVYDNALAERAYRMHLIEDCMEDSLNNGDFKVFYQPKHDPSSGKTVGAEALVRWIHPQYGFMSPGDFIPLFEKNGFISNLDTFIWNKVCSDIKDWQVRGIPVVPVSVNVSRRDLISQDVAETLEKALEKNQIDRTLLHIEITESICVEDSVVFAEIKKIHDHGFIIELDDFGSGYSSLGMITDIPMEYIKLDMSFSRALEKQKEVVKMIISLAHAIGVKTIAEGVETEDQKNTLLSLGCNYIQGYFYSKPLPHDDFESYVQKPSA